MSFLRVIGRALAAMLMTVVVWSDELAKWVVRQLPGSVPPDPAELVDQYQAIAKTEAAAHRPAETVGGIQQVADLLFRQQPIPDEALVGLGEKTTNWLSALNSDMLLLASKSKPEDLSAHMKGARAIRGLLAFDQVSIEAYQQALQRDAEAKKPEPAPKARRRTEQPFSAFGAMC